MTRMGGHNHVSRSSWLQQIIMSDIDINETRLHIHQQYNKLESLNKNNWLIDCSINKFIK